MTEDVLVTIKGLQALEPGSEDEVEVIVGGSYLCKNGRHYIRYEEVTEGLDGTTENLIKVDDQGVEVIKRGLANVHMIFEKDKKNIAYYETPFGSLVFGIAATSIDVRDSEQNLDVKVSYALDVNYQHLADCTLNMTVQSKDAGLHLNH